MYIQNKIFVPFRGYLNHSLCFTSKKKLTNIHTVSISIFFLQHVIIVIATKVADSLRDLLTYE